MIWFQQAGAHAQTKEGEISLVNVVLPEIELVSYLDAITLRYKFRLKWSLCFLMIFMGAQKINISAGIFPPFFCNATFRIAFFEKCFGLKLAQSCSMQNSVAMVKTHFTVSNEFQSII